ncbi:MAG: PfkB family carbohydrate kinase [Gemmatimonadota bacterium]
MSANRSRPRRILAVGSVALDTVESPFGKAEDVIGGSAVHFAAAASLFAPVQIVGVVGDDYPLGELEFLTQRGTDLSGIHRAAGESFRWTGRYSHDLSAPETLETRLGVFADFHPAIPDGFREPDLLFLGNIDPQLQGRVLDQVGSPTMVACDTMNYWIEGSREALLALLERVDTLIVNEGEIRQLAEEPNLLRAARWVRDRGPSRVVVKKGEHGALLLDKHGIFFVPGYPLERIFDPTGAGDAFAGGFLGALAGWGDFSPAGMRRAVVMGSVTGSLAVESFSVDRLRVADRGEVARRAREFRRMTYFDLDEDLGNG